MGAWHRHHAPHEPLLRQGLLLFLFRTFMLKFKVCAYGHWVRRDVPAGTAGAFRSPLHPSVSPFGTAG